MILQIFFGWLLGSFSPAAANFFFPQNNRGNRFLKHPAQKSFAVAENFIRMIGARLFWFFLFGFFILFHSPGNLRFFLYAFSFTALLFFHGIGLTIFICPKKLQPYTLILSPLVGYCFLILMGWYFYNYWPGGTETYANYLLAAPLVLMTAAGVWLANRKETRQTYFDKELLTPLAIGVVIFLFQSIPFLVLENSLTSLSWGNNDIPDSTSVSTYLKSYAKNASDGFLGQASVLQYLASQAVFGGSFSVALASTLFSLETYQLQSLSLHVLFLLSIPLVYILARESFRYNAPGSTLIAALYGLNPIMWWVVYQGYQGQVFATTVTLGLLLLHIHTIQNCRKMSEFIPYIPLAVLFHWGISLTYPHMFPIVFSPLLGYLFFLGFFKKSVAWHWTVFFLVTLLLMALLSFQRAEAILAYFLKMGQFDFGLFIPWIAPHEFFGLWKMDLPGVAPFLISFLMAGIILVGLRNLYRENREVFYLSAASILVVFSGYLLLCFMGQTEEGLGGYKSFKLLSFFLPLILAATLVFFRGITFAAKSFTAVFLVVFLIGGNIGSTFYLAQQMVRNNIVVDSDLADLKKIQDNPRVHSINLLGMEAWSVLWQVNFLISKKLFFGINTYGGRTQSDLDGEWDLLPSNPEALHIAGFDDRETLDLNPTYILKKAGKPKNLKGHLGFGWEKSNSPYMTMQYHTAGIQLYSPGEAFPIDLQAEFIAPAPDCRLAVFLNNKKVGSCGDSQSCRLNHIKLSRWTHYLDFRTEPSCSGYRFTHLKFSPQQP